MSGWRYDVPTTSIGLGLLITVALFPPKTIFKFAPSLLRIQRNGFLSGNKSTADGDKCPTIRDGRPCHYVSQPSRKHLKKMLKSKGVDCIIVKYIMVPSPEYGVVLTICTSGSFEKKELYEVSISDFPACSCPCFKFMKVRANWKRKWMLCKHLYFLLQIHFLCTKDNVFIHCPRWTPNEVRLVLGRAT